MGVPHLPLYLGPGDQGGDAVHHHHIDGVAPYQGFGYLQGLLPRIGLGDEKLIDIDADVGGVSGVQGVLDIDIGRHAPLFLGLCDDVLAQGGLTRGLSPENLDYPAPGYAPDSQGDVQGERTGGDDFYRHFLGRVTQPHDRALTELLLDLGQGKLQGLGFLCGQTFNTSLVFENHSTVTGA